MTVSVDVSTLVESSSVNVYPGEPITVDRLLRRLDVLRQRLAVRWCGSAGSFAGYEVLQLTNHGLVTVGTVQFEARIVELKEKSHVVELTATLTSGRAAAGGEEPTMLAIGRGHTLHTPCMAESC